MVNQFTVASNMPGISRSMSPMSVIGHTHTIVHGHKERRILYVRTQVAAEVHENMYIAWHCVKEVRIKICEV